jgi:hypothetical protein
MSVVYFDEAGNTGAALLDSSQPVFVLASVDYTNDECAELLSMLQTPQAKEVKFSTMRKSASGRKKLIEFIRSSIHQPSRVKISVLHKRYMAVGKIVDIINEPLARISGVDIYEHGVNIGLTNIHYFCTPLFCGIDQFEKFLDSFIRMIRTRTPDSNRQFFDAVRDLHLNCSNEDYKDLLEPYLYSERIVDSILSEITYQHLDPATTSFFAHCVEWGKQKGDFLAIHDDSKPMAAEYDNLKAMMDRAIEPAVIGYGRRKFKFPLKASEIQFANSKETLAIQVADLFASATYYYASAIAKSDMNDFSTELERADIDRFFFLNLWPSTEVTSEVLGTAEVGGTNPAMYMARNCKF